MRLPRTGREQRIVSAEHSLGKFESVRMIEFDDPLIRIGPPAAREILGKCFRIVHVGGAGRGPCISLIMAKAALAHARGAATIHEHQQDRARLRVAFRQHRAVPARTFGPADQRRASA
jgi:hypothetical protein